MDFHTDRIILWICASGIFTEHRCKAHPSSSTWTGQCFLSPLGFFHLCCCSVTKSCPALCDPIDCRTPGFPVHHQLPALAQTPIHRVSNAIQPSHPLSSPSPPACNLSQHQGFFSDKSAVCFRWLKYWSFSFSFSPSSEFSGLISFRMDWLDLLAVQGTVR